MRREFVQPVLALLEMYHVGVPALAGKTAKLFCIDGRL